MCEFEVFPAIDLHQGNVVRLKQGNLSQETQYFENPAVAAQAWIDQGAQWLHVVNLDGAFGKDQGKNIQSLKQILEIANGDALIQFGGGLRNLASIAYILEMGVARVIIGTGAIKNPDFMHGALKTFGPDAIILGVDAKDGLVRVSGWQEDSHRTPQSLIREFLPDNLERVIYTDIHRDGMQSGPDIATAKSLAEETGVRVIASGGVAKLSHILAIRQADLDGVVVGKALYEGNFTLAEAMAC
jgi:phosphoribosylformimino-5-aminoimidazole carboxamide ribotide isomerase